MFRLAGKGFAAVKRGCEVRHKAVAHGGSATRGLFAFLSVDIAQLKSTSVVTREHNRLRRKGFEGKPRGFRTCPKPIRRFRASANHVYPVSLWTLRINRVASLLSLSNSILRSVAHCAAAHRVNEKSRIRFRIVRCNFNHNLDPCTIWILDFNLTEILFEIYSLQKLELIIEKLQ